MDLETAIDTLLAGDEGAAERAARTLAELGAGAAPAALALVGRLATPDPFTRAAVRNALVAAGSDAASALVGGLSAPQALIRAEAMRILERADVATACAAQEQLPPPADKRGGRALEEARALLGARCRPASSDREERPNLEKADLAVLGAALRSDGQNAAATALSEIAARIREGRDAARCLPLLAEVLDPDQPLTSVSVDVLTVAGHLGSGSAEIVHQLRRALAQPRGGNRAVWQFFVSEALALADPHPPDEVIDHLRSALDRGYLGASAARAAYALARLGPRASPAALLLARTLEERFDGDVGVWEVRRWAVTALGRLDEVPPGMPGVLQRAVQSEDIVLALEATHALRRLGHSAHSIPDVLRRARTVPSPPVQATAEELEAEV